MAHHPPRFLLRTTLRCRQLLPGRGRHLLEDLRPRNGLVDVLLLRTCQLMVVLPMVVVLRAHPHLCPLPRLPRHAKEQVRSRQDQLKPKRKNFAGLERHLSLAQLINKRSNY